MIGAFIDEGAVGMTMFFALSGFILSHAYANLKIDFRDYLLNRVARIYPVYLLAAVLALPWLGLQIAEEVSQTNIIYGLLSLAIILVFGVLLIHAWLPQSFAFWNNSASWSISVEAFFYYLFPFLRERINSLEKIGLVTLFFTLCFLSSAIPLSSVVFSNSPGSFTLFYALPAFRLPEFIAGIISYRLMNISAWSMKVKLLLYLILCAGALHVVLLGPALSSYTLHNWILIPAVCSALVILYKQDEASSGLLRGRVAVWLGKISYCFYSFQYHVFALMSLLLPKDLVTGWIYLGASFIALLLISAFIHHFFEETVRVALRTQNKRRRHASQLEKT